MGFPERLAHMRTTRGLTQAELAERAGISPSHLHQCEAGRSQPTLEVLRNLALALSVSADELVFDPKERARHSGDMRSLADAVSKLDKRERESVRMLIEALVYRHETEAARATRKKPGPKPRGR